MKLFFLSFDCATKSLAVILFSYDFSYKDEINKIMSLTDLYLLQKINIVNKILNNVIDIYYLDVIDVCPGLNVNQLDIIQRSNLFKTTIQKINIEVELVKQKYNPDIIHVYIERQPIFNIKSSIVYHQLIYEYSDDSKYKIKVMYPMLKNKVTLHNSLSHGEFISKSNNAYRSNKNHAKANFLYYIETFGLQDKIKHIKKKNLDDIADAFLQVIVDIKHLYN